MKCNLKKEDIPTRSLVRKGSGGGGKGQEWWGNVRRDEAREIQHPHIIVLMRERLMRRLPSKVRRVEPALASGMPKRS
jgi:hypothetical protein